MNHTKVSQDRAVNFKFYSDYANTVAVLGNFNGWQPWQMHRDHLGVFSLDTPPLGEQEIEYKFFVDGNYINDSSNLRYDLHSGNNSWLDLKGEYGSLWHQSFYSKALNKHKRYSIYLPKSYYFSNRSYPVLYLMGGLLDYELDWPNKGRIHLVADYLINRAEMQEMIIVMPDKDESWTDDNRQAQFYYYIIQDLMGYIETNYRIDSSVGRAIEGLSIGAHWGLRIAFNNAYSFSSVSSLSCPLEKDIFNLARQKAGDLQNSGIKVRLNCGDGEATLIPMNINFQKYLASIGVACEFYVGHGPHDWELWEKEIINSLKFHSHALR